LLANLNKDAKIAAYILHKKKVNKDQRNPLTVADGLAITASRCLGAVVKKAVVPGW
jgi:hypothetical protein